jgi:2'-hydroxyisoflavone reductase
VKAGLLYASHVRILLFGGTAFLGRAIVEAAVAAGHEPTLFTRGKTNPELFPHLEHVVGDRESELSLLGDREFDVVVDTSGYLPSVVRASARRLAGRAERYVFISTISVYEDAELLTEHTATLRPSDPESRDLNRDYGGLKKLCEEEVESAFPGGSLVLRPGLIVGAHDYSGRFSYWPRRLARGGEVLAPGRPETRVWLLDVRDLAEWTIRLVEHRTTGVYNTAGPDSPLTMGAVLEECRVAGATNARFTWVDDAFLVEREVVPYTELPLWVPGGDGGYPTIDVSKALAAGLTFRPIGETIRAVLDEDGTSGSGGLFGWTRPPAGLDAERERSLLDEWRARAEP